MGPSFVLLQGLWTGAYVHPAWGRSIGAAKNPTVDTKATLAKTNIHKALSSHTALSNLAAPGQAASGWHVNPWRKKD